MVIRANISITAFLSLSLFLAACGGAAATKTSTMPTPDTKATAQPTPTAHPTPKNGDYPGKGKVTKINNELGSVELNHEKIEGVMEPMIMEFYVSDKALLKGLAVGDQTVFTLRYKDGTEIITAIKTIK